MKLIKKIFSWSRSKYRSFLLRRSTVALSVKSDATLLKNKDNNICYFLPYSSFQSTDDRQLSILANGFHEHLLKKYTHDEISINPTDVVIDCGAFAGGFTVAAKKAGAKEIISVEPSTSNFKCLELNLCLYGVTNAKTVNVALGKECSVGQLNLARSGCDNSILAPDKGSLGVSETVKIDTLENLIIKHDIDPEHLYLKVEAEGFEPEVLKGLGEMRPRVIVVDVTPERDGESPRDEIEKILRYYSYKAFRHTTRCLFATR